MTPAVVGPTHVLCSIGRGTDQVWASARAGIGRITSSQVMDRHFEPIAMGLVPEDALAPLDPELDKLPLPSRARRMLRLATPSLAAVLADAGRPVPVFVGLPDLDAADAPWLTHVPAYLQTQAGMPIDRARSVVVAKGRASALMALEQALAALATDPETPVVVGGVDTYLDLRLLATLDGEQRILGSRVMDGFIPGEGAGFLVLWSESSAPRGTGPRAVVTTAASSMDPGHRYGDEPARGEGLAKAIELARQRMPPPAPIATTFAGFNGENFEAKLWGVARLRHNDLFTEAMVMDHPADKYGDAGAATGAILLAMAAQALVTGTRSGPALVWAASDREPRGCAIVSVGHS
jgi:3-oxoacyl-[acyl-carrier-protein] synthase-1